MYRLASAITLSIASVMANAADPQVGEHESLVLAYNAPLTGSTISAAPVEMASTRETERVMTQTLGMVSASLAYELESRIAKKVTAGSH